jgi:cell wall-associated NlpC family hydrolase
MHHSVSGQDYMVQMGLAVRVKPENARPGDIVIFDNLSHDGIYAGNGQFYHAPRRGDHVKLANIFVENYHFIRVLNR